VLIHITQVMIQMFESRFNGVIPASISSFNNLYQLIIAELSAPTEPFPSIHSISSALCNLPELQLIALANERIIAIPDCLHNLPKLLFLDLEQNLFSATAFPASAIQSSSLLMLHAPNSGITGAILPTSFPVGSALEHIDFADNSITGPIPNFSGSTTLKYINLANNGFSSINPAVFNNIVNLQRIDINLNSLDASLPAFQATGAQLLFVNLAYNRFSGDIPATWDMPQLLTLDVSSNEITGQPRKLALSSALRSVKAFSNRLEVIGEQGVSNNPCFETYVLFATASELDHIDLSDNNLYGSCTVPGVTYFASGPTLQYLDLSNNHITGLPLDLFAATALTVVSFAGNNITEPTMPQGNPSSIYTLIDLSNNPFFRPNQADRLWVDFDTTSGTSVTVTVNGKSYICPNTISSTNSKTILKVDPTFYNYAGCQCSQGSYGQAPNCISIPIAFDFLTADPTVSFTQLSNQPDAPLRSFSDAWYGSQRYLTGLDTIWEIDATNLYVGQSATTGEYEYFNSAAESGIAAATGQYNSINKAIVIILHFCFDITLFNQASDIINILSDYIPANRISGDDISLMSPDGCASFPSAYSSYISTNFPLSAKLVYSRHIVLAPSASVEFISRKSSGQHFFAIQTAQDQCPSDYHVNPANGLCEPEYSASRALQIVIYILAALCCLAVLIISIVVFFKRESTLIRASSKLFTFITLFFIFALSAGSVLYAIIPNNGDDHICTARIWVSCISIMSVLGVIVARSFRVSIIFGSKLLMQIKRITDTYVACIAGLLVGVQIFMLIIFDSLHMSKAEYVRGASVVNNELVWQCSSENGFHDWIGANIAIFGAVMLAGAWVSFKTRAVPSAFNESSHILLILIVMIFFLILLVPLEYLVSDSPNAAIVIQAGGQLILSLTILVILFVPKLYYIFTGRSNDKSMVFSSVGTKISAVGASRSGASQHSVSNTSAELATIPPAQSQAANEV
jgi:Leucine-rich repeat (LRR) protein